MNNNQDTNQQPGGVGTPVVGQTPTEPTMPTGTENTTGGLPNMNDLPEQPNDTTGQMPPAPASGPVSDVPAAPAEGEAPMGGEVNPMGSDTTQGGGQQ